MTEQYLLDRIRNLIHDYEKNELNPLGLIHLHAALSGLNDTIETKLQEELK